MQRIWAIFRITLKRLWAQRGLNLAILLGLVTAVALISSVPLYADAVQFRVMQERLQESVEDRQTLPFSYMYSYIGPWYGAIQWEDIQPIDGYLKGAGARALGLPLEFVVRHVESLGYRLYPSGETNYEDFDSSLLIGYFATTEGIEEKIEIFEGTWPETAELNTGSEVEVLIAESLALEAGLQVGDTLTAYNWRDSGDDSSDIPVRVAGVWRALDPEEPYWFFRQNVFYDLLLVPEETFSQRFSQTLEDEVNQAIWYMAVDGSAVGVNDVDSLVSRSRRVEQQVEILLPETSSFFSPIDGLHSYMAAVGELTQLLAVFSVPLVILILAFIGLIVGLSVNQRRNEIAVMRSRGATSAQIVGLAALEGLLLGLAALALGLAGGLFLTQLMGKVRSFLDFSAVSVLRIALNDAALRAGLMAVVLAVLAQVIPTLSAAGDTIITYKQDQARMVKRPWWQRAGLDFLLLIVAGYGIYMLQKQDGIFIGEEGDVLANPLLLLLPALISLAITLFVLRLLPWLMEAVNWILAKSDSVGILLAVRHMARTPGQYATPLIMIVLTVSLAVFTASLARTLDLQLYDDMLYNIGADVKLIGAGRSFNTANAFGPPSTRPETKVFFLPMSEYLNLPEVEAATRIGRYAGTAYVGDERIYGTFLGIDRQDFPQTAFWRYDFAGEDLGTMLNKLAISPDSILVSQDFMQEQGLVPGAFVRLNVTQGEATMPLLVQVVGSFNYFPSWYPEEDGPLFVGHLDELFTQFGGDLPYEVWLHTSPEFDGKAFDEALDDRGLYGWRWSEPYAHIDREQFKPTRQGVFGLLSVGFVAAALLTVLGFFLYALFSFRKRFIELGILRAIGLSWRQMLVLVGGELAFLIISGLTLGTVLGTWISRLFIPAMQKEGGQVPPYLVEIAWPAIFQVYALFALMFVAALIILAVMLARMRIFQAIKLGETA